MTPPLLGSWLAWLSYGVLLGLLATALFSLYTNLVPERKKKSADEIMRNKPRAGAVIIALLCCIAVVFAPGFSGIHGQLGILAIFVAFLGLWVVLGIHVLAQVAFSHAVRRRDAALRMAVLEQSQLVEEPGAQS